MIARVVGIDLEGLAVGPLRLRPPPLIREYRAEPAVAQRERRLDLDGLAERLLRRRQLPLLLQRHAETGVGDGASRAEGDGDPGEAFRTPVVPARRECRSNGEGEPEVGRMGVLRLPQQPLPLRTTLEL